MYLIKSVLLGLARLSDLWEHGWQLRQIEHKGRDTEAHNEENKQQLEWIGLSDISIAHGGCCHCRPVKCTNVLSYLVFVDKASGPCPTCLSWEVVVSSCLQETGANVHHKTQPEKRDTNWLNLDSQWRLFEDFVQVVFYKAHPGHSYDDQHGVETRQRLEIQGH